MATAFGQFDANFSQVQFSGRLESENCEKSSEKKMADAYKAANFSLLATRCNCILSVYSEQLRTRAVFYFSNNFSWKICRVVASSRSKESFTSTNNAILYEMCSEKKNAVKTVYFSHSVLWLIDIVIGIMVLTFLLYHIFKHLKIIFWFKFTIIFI